MVSRGDDTYISSRVFTIRVEPVIIGGEEHEDGFTLFVDAINAYENATEISTAAATAANQAAQLADTARTELLAAAENGGFDGTDGRDGADGFSPTATVTATEGGCTITITDIANAICFQRGDGELFKPCEMAAAVAALDGSYAGGYQPQDYMELESGVLPESVFSDIADAVRGQNGLSTLYAPGEMAAAILALE